MDQPYDNGTFLGAIGWLIAVVIVATVLMFGGMLLASARWSPFVTTPSVPASPTVPVVKPYVPAPNPDCPPGSVGPNAPEGPWANPACYG